MQEYRITVSGAPPTASLRAKRSNPRLGARMDGLLRFAMRKRSAFVADNDGDGPRPLPHIDAVRRALHEVDGESFMPRGISL
jgi:hypothetical protein